MVRLLDRSEREDGMTSALTTGARGQRALFAAAFIIAASPAHAGDQGDGEPSCDGSTYQMVECLKAKTAQWDKRMNAAYQQALNAAGLGQITTEILPMPEFFYAEDYHQQYLAKNPNGYCGIGGTGVSCPIGAGVAAG